MSDDLREQPEAGGESAGYGFEDEVRTKPALPGEVVALPTVDGLLDRLAADLVLHAENCVRQFGDFQLALSGGSSFELLYQRLMYDPNYRRLPWRRTQLWFVEEWCVPFDDERSNYRMIRETVGDHADIPQEQLHPIFAMSETADTDYEAAIRESLSWRERGQDRLDYVLLGLGDDGRTAGLLPGSSATEVKDRLVCRNASPEADSVDRVTMTTALMNSARFIAVLGTGASKTEAIDRVVRADGTPRDLPIMGIKPIDGELKWYLDGSACGEDHD